MSEGDASGGKELRLYPAPPKGFDPFAATDDDLKRHGLPLRPNPDTQPGMAALWERVARRYQGFEHLEPAPDTSTAVKRQLTAGPFDPDPLESCGYSLASTTAAPFTALFVHFTVPDLQFSPSPFRPNQFHTFVGLGFLDLHVEMTVNSAQTVTSQLWAEAVGDINLPVRPGDIISGALCLDTKPPGTAHYVLANETSGQTMNFNVDTGFPPAVSITAGVTRDGWTQPNPPLARFGTVYFDEISAYTTAGSRSLTAGDAITMVDQNGATLASPVMLTDYAFKAVFVNA
jgi:hypothetical protein